MSDADRAAKDGTKKTTPSSAFYRRIFFVLFAIALAIGLRMYRLETDAYPGLSWDTGLFTDEGFYLHNARNVILFGKLRTDEFNNIFLMPLLHPIQLAWFRCFGVGSVQTRLFSVAFSLLTLPFYFDALRRLFERRTATLATVFLTFDHVNLLYNRMGLMDTPAAFAMVVALWAFSRTVTGEGRERARYAILCGVSVGTTYAVRGLALAILPAFFFALKRDRKNAETTEETDKNFMCYFIIGLVMFFTLFLALWYFPNHAEIARINAFHLKEQLLPKTVPQLGRNLVQAVSGIRYLGLLPYLLTHSPVLLIFTLIGLIKPFSTDLEERERCGVRLLRGWIVALWLLFAISNYAPSRYYVLFYPAMMALAAHQLTAISYRSNLPQWKTQWKINRRMFFFFVIWGIVNTSWMTHWLFTLKTTRRDSERWLVQNLPSNTVLIGDCAPGLALDSGFRTINVQPGLCNDRDTLTKFENSPQVIVILDGVWKEKWWTEHYPVAVSKEHRLTLFNPLISHTVGVYSVENTKEVGRERNVGR